MLINHRFSRSKKNRRLPQKAKCNIKINEDHKRKIIQTNSVTLHNHNSERLRDISSYDSIKYHF